MARVIAPIGQRAVCRVVAGSRRQAAPKRRVLTNFAGFRAANVVDSAGASKAPATLQAAVARAGVRGDVAKGTTSMMFERFTEKAIKVVMLAQEEARRLGHNFVGTEQILLGLIGESTGIAAKVLKSLGVTLKDARTEVEKVIGRGSGFVAVEIPFTPRAKRVLELSLEEARQLGALREVPGPFAAVRPRWACLSLGDVWCRPQLHRHRAHPARPPPRGRGRCCSRSGDPWC